MPQRPTSLLGLAVHYTKTKWAGLGTPARAVVITALILGSLSMLSVGRYMVFGRTCSGGCPYSAGASAQTPCGG